MENGQLYITHESVIDGKKFYFLRNERAEPRNPQNSKCQAVLTHFVRIVPVTGIEVFKSAGTLIEVQVPPQQPGNLSLFVVTSESARCVIGRADDRLDRTSS